MKQAVKLCGRDGSAGQLQLFGEYENDPWVWSKQA
jgi:hypothetical protein